MERFESTEALLAWIVDFFADRFGNSAILNGGMSLRLMHSPRYTNDVDYIFVPFDSKKDGRRTKVRIDPEFQGVAHCR